MKKIEINLRETVLVKTAVRKRAARVINRAYRIWEAIMSSNLKGIKSAELKYIRSLSWKNLLRGD